MEIGIGNRKIGGSNSAFLIADLSANHNHNFEIAKKTIKAAKESGADAIKLQTYTPDTITIDCDNKYFSIKHGLWEGRTLYDLYRKAYTPWEWHEELKEYSESLGLSFFSTPFDKTAVDFLEGLGVQFYKVASFEIHDIPLIEYIAKKGKPIIISTGIATKGDIEEAYKTCKKNNNENIIFLKCTSAYPTPIENANLKNMQDIAKSFGTIVGLSDHTIGTTVPIAAVSMGAKIIEKHFIIDRKLGGPDATFSLEPSEFKEMVGSIREVEKAVGSATYELPDKVTKNIKFARSLFVVKNIKKGEKLTEENIRSIRPGYGMHPKHYFKVLGKKASKTIEMGTPLNWEMIE